MGADSTPATQVTLESWAQFIAGLAHRNPGSTLLGHSRAGVLISRAAELAPEAIRRLVYLSAYLLPDGDSVAAESRRDHGSMLAANMIPVTRGVSCGLRDEVLREAFYADCSDADVEHARQRLSPEPLKPLATSLRISAQRFGSVPRAYIETTRDRAISPEAQRRMRSVLPCAPVFTLDTGHSPFLSQPEALARILISI
jgi:pimeloyl-ACP methyl ester carboxylesterase